MWSVSAPTYPLHPRRLPCRRRRRRRRQGLWGIVFPHSHRRTWLVTGFSLVAPLTLLSRFLFTFTLYFSLFPLWLIYRLLLRFLQFFKSPTVAYTQYGSLIRRYVYVHLHASIMRDKCNYCPLSQLEAVRYIFLNVEPPICVFNAAPMMCLAMGMCVIICVYACTADLPALPAATHNLLWAQVHVRLHADDKDTGLRVYVNMNIFVLYVRVASLTWLLSRTLILAHIIFN